MTGMRGFAALAAVAAGLLGAACGGDDGEDKYPLQHAEITIENNVFTPLHLEVAPNTVVTVTNLDVSLHSVTSESAVDAFTNGPVNGISFDTGEFTGTAEFKIPASAKKGTVIPYFCSAHAGGMQQGSITVK